MSARIPRDRSIAGFNLPELLLVLAIMGVVPGFLLPAVGQKREEINQKAIPGALQTIVAAEATFRTTDPDGDGLADYGTFSELFAYGLLGLPLANGQAHGYDFSITLTIIPAAGYIVVAMPASPTTASLRFFVDQTGIIRFVQYGTPWASDPPLGEGDECMVPTTPAIKTVHDSIDDAARQTIVGLSTFSSDDVISEAVALLSDPANVDVILQRIDANGDDGVSWEEVLDSDLLAVARVLVDDFPQYSPGPAIGLDSDLTPLLTGFQAQAATEFELGVWIEEPTPPVSIASLSGDPSAYLRQLVAVVPTLGPLGLVLLGALLASVGLRKRLR